MLDIYEKPWSHAGPYCIGLILGYLILHRKIPKLRASVRRFGWTIALASLIAILFSTYHWNNGVPYSTFEAVLYAATCRTAFAAVFAWIVAMSATDQGGWISDFLSAKAFVPLSRCTYMVFLSHMWFVWAYIGSRRHILDTNPSTGVSFDTKMLSANIHLITARTNPDRYK